jgi:hypothetical protein
VTASSAHLSIHGDGRIGVDATIRPGPGTLVRCCLYDDRPAILTLDDGPVHVAITVPDSDQVTAEDLADARDLAAAVTTYLTDLEQHHAAQPATPGQAA